MSLPTPLKADPGINQPLIIRKARVCEIIFRFWTDEAHTVPYAITDDFRFLLKPMAESSDDDAIMDITNADDLVIEDNEIRVPVTAIDSDIDRKKCFYELINTTTNVNWFQDDVQIISGKAPSESTVTEADGTINVGDTVVNVAIDLISQTGSVNLESLATELTFDHDKEFETVLGGTTTFTLAASGNNNGVGIIARINQPVAVNFPAGSEAVNGSDPIDPASMNIIVFRYYADYDGAGNAKLMYVVKNQTAV